MHTVRSWNEQFMSSSMPSLDPVIMVWFRKGYYSTTCLLDFLDGIYDDIESNCGSGVLLLNLHKAFDTVEHQI